VDLKDKHPIGEQKREQSIGLEMGEEAALEDESAPYKPPPSKKRMSLREKYGKK